MAIHPTAILSDDCEIHPSVEIGPYCLLMGRVVIGAGTKLEGHVVIGSEYGEVKIGENNYFTAKSFLGGAPQDITYKNEPTTLVVGDGNVFRELSTINKGTVKGGGTVVGNNNYFMAYTHIGHDCKVASNIVVANDTHIGGHVTIEDHVKVMGVCACNQYVTIGKYSMLAGGSVVNKDVLPFTQAQGNFAVSRATNKIGLQRAGFDEDRVNNIHRAVRMILMGTDTMAQAKERIQNECEVNEDVQYLFDFIDRSKRGIAK